MTNRDGCMKNYRLQWKKIIGDEVKLIKKIVYVTYFTISTTPPIERDRMSTTSCVERAMLGLKHEHDNIKFARIKLTRNHKFGNIMFYPGKSLQGKTNQ